MHTYNILSKLLLICRGSYLIGIYLKEKDQYRLWFLFHYSSTLNNNNNGHGSRAYWLSADLWTRTAVYNAENINNNNNRQRAIRRLNEIYRMLDERMYTYIVSAVQSVIDKKQNLITFIFISIQSFQMLFYHIIVIMYTYA